MHFARFTKWIFETGRLAPGYDWFRCVVNIPEDVERVDDPEGEGELAMMSTAAIKTYSSTDERNGRINPALEADDEMDAAAEAIRQRRQSASKAPAVGKNVGIGGGGGGGGGSGFDRPRQDQTAF
jgi:solute carrier family 5 (high affinity choline transporter), member 7